MEFTEITRSRHISADGLLAHILSPHKHTRLQEHRRKAGTEAFQMRLSFLGLQKRKTTFSTFSPPPGAAPGSFAAVLRGCPHQVALQERESGGSGSGHSGPGHRLRSALCSGPAAASMPQHLGIWGIGDEACGRDGASPTPCSVPGVSREPGMRLSHPPSLLPAAEIWSRGMPRTPKFIF